MKCKILNGIKILVLFKLIKIYEVKEIMKKTTLFMN